MSNIIKRFGKRWGGAGGGVPPAFLFAVALAHPVVYSHFRILQGKKRKLYKKVWKKMRGCRGRRKEPYKKAGGTPKGFFFSPCNKSVIFYNTANNLIIWFQIHLRLWRWKRDNQQLSELQETVFRCVLQRGWRPICRDGFFWKGPDAVWAENEYFRTKLNRHLLRLRQGNQTNRYANPR